jgi:hypothetical protein
MLKLPIKTENSIEGTATLQQKTDQHKDQDLLRMDGNYQGNFQDVNGKNANQDENGNWNGNRGRNNY